jgi:hypothetical protein
MHVSNLLIYRVNNNLKLKKNIHLMEKKTSLNYNLKVTISYGNGKLLHPLYSHSPKEATKLQPKNGWFPV